MQRYMNIKKYRYKENIRNIDTAEEAKAGLGVNEAIMQFYIPKPTQCLIQTCKPLFYTIIKRDLTVKEICFASQKALQNRTKVTSR